MLGMERTPACRDQPTAVGQHLVPPEDIGQRVIVRQIGENEWIVGKTPPPNEAMPPAPPGPLWTHGWIGSPFEKGCEVFIADDPLRDHAQLRNRFRFFGGREWAIAQCGVRN